MPPASDLLALARAAAAYHELDSALVCAIVEQESAWNPHAIRYEPAFRTRYVAPLGLPPTEEIARSISWGLMQVMGQVAREHGFQAKFLSALCDPALGLDIGCAVLASKIAATTEQGNGGSSVIPSGASRDFDFARSAGTRTRGISLGLPSEPSSRPQEPARAAAVSKASSMPQSGQGIAAREPEIARALQLWNGGSNPNYAAEVLARLPRYK